MRSDAADAELAHALRCGGVRGSGAEESASRRTRGASGRPPRGDAARRRAAAPSPFAVSSAATRSVAACSAACAEASADSSSCFEPTRVRSDAADAELAHALRCGGAAGARGSGAKVSASRRTRGTSGRPPRGDAGPEETRRRAAADAPEPM